MTPDRRQGQNPPLDGHLTPSTIGHLPPGRLVIYLWLLELAHGCVYGHPSCSIIRLRNFTEDNKEIEEEFSRSLRDRRTLRRAMHRVITARNDDIYR
jgi:hypothetical protein